MECFIFKIYQIPHEKQTGSEWECLVGSQQSAVESRQWIDAIE